MSEAQPLSSKVVTSVTVAARTWGAATQLRRMRLRLGFEGRGDGTVCGVAGHGDPEMRARILAVDDLDRAAVRRDKLEHHRQADAGAFYRSALGGPAGI